MSGHASLSKFLENLAHKAARWTGSSIAFLLISGLALAWLITGPVYGFSVEWQMVMNTVSSATTFVMVFLLQRSQNKDSLAMQIKLNEIIAALHGADNRLINVEDMDEEEIIELQKNYQELASHIQSTDEISIHSITHEDKIAASPTPHPETSE